MEFTTGDKKIEIMARRENWQEGVSLFLRHVTIGSSIVVAKPLTFESYENGEIAKPFLQLSIHTAQQLMDELWQCGLRPTEGTGSAGSLKATENHLADMRKIVFKQLNLKEK